MGNIPHNRANSYTTPVHPHACGEHPIPEYPTTHVCGSSPRVWGTFGDGYRLDHPARFIPTRVGNMTSARNHSFPRTVHPHACGEHALEGYEQDYYNGSSPRVWGTYFYSCLKRLKTAHLRNKALVAPKTPYQNTIINRSHHHHRHRPNLLVLPQAEKIRA